MKLLPLLLLCLHCAGQQHCIKVTHTHFWFMYDTVIKAPVYTYYIQTKAHAKMGSVDRKGYSTFSEDVAIPARYRVPHGREYKSWNSSHDLAHRRDVGHLAPYTALAYDNAGAKESMDYEQCSPQVSWFNEHSWLAVEMYVLKKLATQYDTVQVWTGVIYGKKYMGLIPESDYYWKVVKFNGQYKAWLGKNDESNKDDNIDDIETTVQNIIRLTALKF